MTSEASPRASTPDRVLDERARAGAMTRIELAHERASEREFPGAAADAPRGVISASRRSMCCRSGGRRELRRALHKRRPAGRVAGRSTSATCPPARPAALARCDSRSRGRTQIAPSGTTKRDPGGPNTSGLDGSHDVKPTRLAATSPRRARSSRSPGRVPDRPRDDLQHAPQWSSRRR